MIGQDRTVRAALRDLGIAVLRLHPERLAKWVDRDLTHTRVPPALRPVPSPVRLSALDRAAREAAEFEHRADPSDIGYIEEIW